MQLDKTPVKGCEKIKFGCDAYWECAVRMQTAPENHQAGSCKMGPRGDRSAVVDNLLQVIKQKALINKAKKRRVSTFIWRTTKKWNSLPVNLFLEHYI